MDRTLQVIRRAGALIEWQVLPRRGAAHVENDILAPPSSQCQKALERTEPNFRNDAKFLLAMTEPIDVVYTWVDDTFPGYRDLLDGYAGTSHDLNPNRTRDNLDLLKYGAIIRYWRN